MIVHGRLGLGATFSAVQDKIRAAAIAQGVPPDLALSVASRESGFSQSALGAAGEVGIFQLMPATAAGLGVNPYDEDGNIRGGIAYLRQMYDQFGDWSTALSAYNCGPGNISAGVTCKTTPQYVAGVLANQSSFSSPGIPSRMPDSSLLELPSLVTEIPSSFDSMDLGVEQAETAPAGVDLATVGLLAAAAVLGVVILT